MVNKNCCRETMAVASSGARVVLLMGGKEAIEN